MERSQLQQDTADKFGNGAGESSQSHLLTNENRRLLVQYFASRTSSSGQIRQWHSSYNSDIENSHYHGENARHDERHYPSVTSNNHDITDHSHHVTSGNHHVVRYVCLIFI